MMGFEVLVEHPERADDPTSFITEERVGDPCPVGERAKIGGTVVADREQGVARALEPGQRSLQLDQLRLAVRSPDRAPVQDHDGATPIAPGVQIDDLAALIG